MPAWLGSGLRCVPPHSLAVELYTGWAGCLRLAASPGKAGLTVLCCVCFVRKSNTEDGDKDSDRDNDNKNL